MQLRGQGYMQLRPVGQGEGGELASEPDTVLQQVCTGAPACPLQLLVQPAIVTPIAR